MTVDVGTKLQVSRQYRLPYLLDGITDGIGVANEVLSLIDAVMITASGIWSLDGDETSIQDAYKKDSMCVVIGTASPTGVWSQFPNGSLLIYDKTNQKWNQIPTPDGLLFHAIAIAGGTNMEAGFIVVRENGSWRRLLYKENLNFTKSTLSASDPPVLADLNSLQATFHTLCDQMAQLGGPYATT